MLKKLREVGVTVLSAMVIFGATALAGDGGAQDKETIVIGHFGDSTCSTVYLSAGDRIDRQLNDLLSSHYTNQCVININVAKGGDYIQRFLGGRYQQSTRERVVGLDIALIRYGQNDIKVYSAEEFGKRLADLCDQLEKDFPGVHIILETNSWMDPVHYGEDRKKANAKWNELWDVVRSLAKERSYPVVDLQKRKQVEAAKGNWDQHIRNQELSKERFGHRIIDNSRDEEMKGVENWFRDGHPNAFGVKIMAEEEYNVITNLWPDRLPCAESAISGVAEAKE